MTPSAISRYMSKLGKKGADAAHANRTPVERKKLAMKGAKARWAKNSKKH